MIDEIPQVNSIFQQPWWLEAVAPGQWDEVVVVDNSSQIIGRLPYLYKSKLGLQYVGMPLLTQTLGPWFQLPSAKYANQLEKQKDLFDELIGKLPKFDVFVQNFHFSFRNWLPFYWHGFSQTTRYTYAFENLDDLDKIWQGMQKNIRGYVRKAEKQLEVKTDLDVDEFLRINALTFERQGLNLPYSSKIVHRLDAACQKHEAGRNFYAQDKQGRIHAAIYVVWDSNSAYYLMSGADPELRSSGATSLLLWEAIKFAATVTKRFDFEGSMIEPIERFFRAFGAKQVPYFQVSKMSKRAKVLATGRDFFKASWELLK